MTLIKSKGLPPSNTHIQKAGILNKTAISKLNVQAPELSQYVVAFKDLTEELPENTGIQVGMIILDIKGKYIYVPVVAKAGEIQILESMFDAETKEFIPLTSKSIEYMVDTGFQMGKSERIPKGVAKDPNLYDAIVPPRTGKFVYASEGRVGGFFATMPNHLKQAAHTILSDDYDLQEALVPLMDLEMIKSHLTESSAVGHDADSEVGPMVPQVLTAGKDLSEEQVQEIMAKGYTVLNPPKSKKVAVESSEASYGALTYGSSLNPGMAANAMRTDGSWCSVAMLRMLPQATEDSDRNPINRETVSQEPGVLLVTSKGEYITEPRVVINSAECSYDDVLEYLKSKSILDVSNGDLGVMFVGGSFVGPMQVRSVVKANGWTTIETNKNTIMTHPNVKGLCDRKGRNLFVSDTAVFYPLTNGFHSMETDIGKAQFKADIEMSKVLPYQSTLIHRNGSYAVDGKEIGNKPKIVEHLLREWEIDVPSVETFVKKAEDNNQVIVKMAAVRGSGSSTGEKGTKVQPHYQHGLQPGSDDNQLTGSALQRARGMATSAKGVKDIADREVMEATLISEMLQNPDLAGSIKEYLPDIKQAVDKLGRTLFLMRINTHKLNDSIDSEALNNLFTGTRNAYRILGENCVKLERLASNELDD